ncbi:MAG TPA: YdbL family protein [Sphingomicrobium sp.]|nr:YdbL family protein [Sphingomicrobium sp.]
MIRLLAGLTVLGLTAPAAAQTPALNAARQAGVIGERFDGYMGYAVAPSAALRSQVEAVNIRRRALYSNLAASKGVSPQEVGITAGCQLLAKVAVGQAYMLNDGAWRRRAAGQGAPVPSYCG